MASNHGWLFHASNQQFTLLAHLNYFFTNSVFKFFYYEGLETIQLINIYTEIFQMNIKIVQMNIKIV